MTCTYCGATDHARHCPLCGRGMMERCEPCGVTYTPRPLVQEDEPQPATVPYDRVEGVPWNLHAAEPGVNVRMDRLDAALRTVWRGFDPSRDVYGDAWLSLPMDDDP